MNLDEKRLVKLRQYEVDNYKNLKIVKKGNKYIGKFPKAIVTGDKADMTEALDQWRLTQLIYDVAWQKEQCVIEGYVFLRGLCKCTKIISTFGMLKYRREDSTGNTKY